MDIQIILVNIAAVVLQVLCEKSIHVTDNLRKKIALEVLKVSPVSTVISPFALSLPLCKIATVAKGHTKQELMSALGISRESQVKYCYTNFYPQMPILLDTGLMMQNVVYLDDSMELDAGFRNNSKVYHAVRFDRVSYRYRTAAAKYMNRWFAQETLYRVSTLVDEDDIDNTTSIVILNGLYYKVGWESPFNTKFTAPKEFYTTDNKMWMLPMMSKIDSFLYLDDDSKKFKAIKMNLNTPGASIIFFLPSDRAGLPGLINRFYDDPELLMKVTKLMLPKVVRVFLPRMKIKTYVDWTGFLRLIGINGIFSVDSSGLEGMLKNNSGHVHLSKAKQKVFLEVDEMGLERGGPGGPGYGNESDREEREFAYFGDQVEPVEIEHPFFFIVLVSSKEQYPILTGVFYGPQEE